MFLFHTEATVTLASDENGNQDSQPGDSRDDSSPAKRREPEASSAVAGIYKVLGIRIPGRLGSIAF
jgi:hypothetical protein